MATRKHLITRGLVPLSLLLSCIGGGNPSCPGPGNGISNDNNYDTAGTQEGGNPEYCEIPTHVNVGYPETLTNPAWKLVAHYKNFPAENFDTETIIIETPSGNITRDVSVDCHRHCLMNTMLQFIQDTIIPDTFQTSFDRSFYDCRAERIFLEDNTEAYLYYITREIVKRNSFFTASIFELRYEGSKAIWAEYAIKTEDTTEYQFVLPLSGKGNFTIVSPEDFAASYANYNPTSASFKGNEDTCDILHAGCSALVSLILTSGNLAPSTVCVLFDVATDSPKCVFIMAVVRAFINCPVDYVSENVCVSLLQCSTLYHQCGCPLIDTPFQWACVEFCNNLPGCVLCSQGEALLTQSAGLIILENICSFFNERSRNIECSDYCEDLYRRMTSCVDEDGDTYYFYSSVCSDERARDCDDHDAFVFPGAREVCGNIRDDDCDMGIDEDCVISRDYCNGRDDDGVNGCDDPYECCQNQPNQECSTFCGSVGVGDCNWLCRINHCEPPAEICNGHDDNCDGTTDEGCDPCDGFDNDGDTQCDEDYFCCRGNTRSCTSSGSVGIQRCDDSCLWGTCCVPSIEVCNYIDDDCDGLTDEGVLNACGRCGPVTIIDEICFNHTDDDCDTLTDEDCSFFDAGTDARDAGSDARDATDAGDIHDVVDTRDVVDIADTRDTCECVPGARDTRSCTCGGTESRTCTTSCIWGSWSGCVTGLCTPGMTSSCTTTCGTTGTMTCNSSCLWDPCRPPAETCDGIDNDCDGATDEGFECPRGRTESCTTACRSTGTRTCSSSCTWGVCQTTEVCNACDDDGDTIVDDGFACVRDSVRPCPTDRSRTQTCSITCEWPDWCDGVSRETCNGRDDDSDGQTDEDFECSPYVSGRQTGSCASSCDSRVVWSRTCDSTCHWGPCTGPATESNCTNSRDDDCDGSTDRCDRDCGGPTTENCTNGIDDDCDGATDCDDSNCSSSSACRTCTDSDRDGYYRESGCGTSQDCDDSRSSVYPGATESCTNSRDDDCDGRTDCSDSDCSSSSACSSGCSGCTPGASESCTTSCGTRGTRTCSSSCTWNPCRATEVCNNCDDDADTHIDDGVSRDCTRSDCPVARQTCIMGSWTDCVCI